MRSILVLAAFTGCAPAAGTIDMVDAVDPADDPPPETPYGDAAEEPEPAAELPWLILTNVELEDANGDWHWRQDEPAMLHATLVNTRDEDFSWYPGMTATVDDARVDVETGGPLLYMMFGRTAVDLALRVAPPRDLAVGDEVTFTLQVSSYGCEQDPPQCPGDDTVRVSASIE